MIIRDNEATCAVYTDPWYPMIRVTWDPPVTAPGRCQSNPHGHDSGSQRNPLPLNILNDRWHCNAPTRYAVENTQNSGPVDVGVMPVGIVRSKMA
jgi:hypothetical protein